MAAEDQAMTKASNSALALMLIGALAHAEQAPGEPAGDPSSGDSPPPAETAPPDSWTWFGMGFESRRNRMGGGGFDSADDSFGGGSGAGGSGVGGASGISGGDMSAPTQQRGKP